MITPGCAGATFQWSRLEPVQQRARILIAGDSAGSYTFLTSKSPLLDPLTVKLHLYVWILDEDNEWISTRIEEDCYTIGWPTKQQSIEVRAKTPDLLSNDEDKRHLSLGPTSFFYHVELFRQSNFSRDLELFDECTSNTFRTASHSKLVKNRRRQKKVRRSKRRKPESVDSDYDQSVAKRQKSLQVELPTPEPLASDYDPPYLPSDPELHSFSSDLWTDPFSDYPKQEPIDLEALV